MVLGWIVTTAWVCSSTGCGTSTGGEVGSGQPAKVLYEKAMSAVDDERFDIASLTLQTLVNTYPESEYAEKARALLTDPRIENCGDSWDSSSCVFSGECGVRRHEYSHD